MRPARLIPTVGLLAVAVAIGAAGADPAWADTRLCTGYSECTAAGYPDFGYAANAATPYWQMAVGHNCTNYVAYRMVRAGLPNTRPAADPGQRTDRLDAYQWGVVYASRTDSRPQPGAVAWWGADSGKGTIGHVAYVESVNPDGSITISEDSSSGHDFDWKVVEPGRGWPSGFIHFSSDADSPVGLPSGETPRQAPSQAPRPAPQPASQQQTVPRAPRPIPPRPIPHRPWRAGHAPRRHPAPPMGTCFGAMAAAACPTPGARP